ncbi:MAG: insulinase family protein [Lacunisphaera sp.]|nr:insulinase family protein [Lacunisphaera sp.]
MIFLRPTRSVRLLTIALGMTGGLRAQSSPASASASDTPLVTRTLPNGLEVVVFPDHSVPLVTVEMAIKMGSVFETAKDSGLAHLYEHMFFRSNRAVVNNEEYMRDIGSKGIVYNGSTHEEFANFYLTGLKEDVHYMRDSALYPTFDPGEVANEKEVVIGELDRMSANPSSGLATRASALLFPANPTFKLPGGLADVVSAATPAQMQAMHKRRVPPANAVLVVAGDCDPAEVFRLATEYFGTWSRGTEDPLTPDPGPPLTRSVAEINEPPDADNVILQFTWRGPSMGNDTGATYAADVLSYVLNQPASRLQKLWSTPGWSR